MEIKHHIKRNFEISFSRSQSSENVVKITENPEHEKPPTRRPMVSEEFLLKEKKIRSEKMGAEDCSGVKEIKVDLVSPKEDVGTNV